MSAAATLAFVGVVDFDDDGDGVVVVFVVADVADEEDDELANGVGAAAAGASTALFLIDCGAGGINSENQLIVRI